MTSEALQDRLTDLVLTNPDVVTIYPIRPTRIQIASRVLSAAAAQPGRRPKAVLSTTAAGTAVEVSVGVTGKRPAPAVCRELHDSIHAELTNAHAAPPLSITVKISSIG